MELLQAHSPEIHSLLGMGYLSSWRGTSIKSGWIYLEGGAGFMAEAHRGQRWLEQFQKKIFSMKWARLFGCLEKELWYCTGHIFHYLWVPWPDYDFFPLGPRMAQRSKLVRLKLAWLQFPSSNTCVVMNSSCLPYLLLLPICTFLVTKLGKDIDCWSDRMRCNSTSSSEWSRELRKELRRNAL